MYGAVNMIRGGRVHLQSVAAVCLLVAFGLWRRQVWARWLGVLISGGVVAGVIGYLAQGGSIAAATLGATFVHGWLVCVLIWRWPPR